VLSRTLTAFIILATAALIAAGCGGSSMSISDVETCLKEAGLTVERAKDDDPSVIDGVTGITGIEEGKLTVALAAEAKSQEKVDDFKKDNKAFTDKLKQDNKKFQVVSGSDGTFVWLVGGAKNDKTYEAARKCVEP
jgi:hypothetical protein